jgi:hypothetical protein
MPLDSRPATRHLRRQAVVFSLVGALIAVLLFGATANAGSRAFHPVVRGERKLVFKPRGLSPEAIAKAQVQIQRGHGRSRWRVSAARVRRALARHTTLTVHTPRRTHGGRLRVTTKRKQKPDRSTTPAATESCDWGSFISAVSVPGACWRPYADASAFNTPVAGKPLASNSAAVVSRLMTLATTPDKVNTGNSGLSGDYSHPIYYSESSDPLFTIHCTEAWGTCEVEGMQVRIPNQAKAAAGSDGHMAVIDQAAGWEYDFWQVKSKPSGGGTISIGWGGRTAIGTAASDGRGSNATAAQVGLAAGVIRPSELAAGEIDHALFMVVKCTSGTSVWPAGAGSGSACADKTNAPAMGQHFYLDMTETQINALSVSAWQKTILRAMATYGLYVGDTGSGGWGIQFESGASFTSFGQTDPWVTLGDQYGVPKSTESSSGRSLRVWDFGSAVDWASKLKVAAS